MNKMAIFSLNSCGPATGQHPAHVAAETLIWQRWLAMTLLLLASWFALTAQAATEADFLPPEQAFRLSSQVVEPNTLTLRFDVEPDYYLYREPFEFKAEPEVGLGEPQLPRGAVIFDPFFEKELETYRDAVEITIPLPAEAQPFVLQVTSQGCADAGLCYPPQTWPVALDYAPVSGWAVQALVPDSGWGDSASSSGSGSGGLFGSFGGFGGFSGFGGSSSASGTSGVDAGGLSGTGGSSATGSGVSTLGGASSAGGLGGASEAGWGGWRQANDLGLAQALAGAALWQTAAVFFVLGLLLSFTPCVLPMVPILSSLLVGDQAQQESRGQAVGRGRGLGLAVAYVLGMSLVYTAAGVAAGLTGASLAATLQTPWVLTVFALLLGLLALAMFDVITVQVPSSWQTSLSRGVNRLPGGRFTGAFAMGAVSALIVGPCVAAPLAGALLYISQTGDVVVGGVALFAMAWGMGVILLVAGASASSLLPRAGAWMEDVKHVFGVLLLAVAWWMLLPIVSPVVAMGGWAILAFFAASVLGAFAAVDRQASLGRRTAQGMGWLLALLGAIQVVGLASGGRDALQPLGHFARAPAASAPAEEAQGFRRVASLGELEQAVAASAGRPVLLDFYADWCVSCKEMERFTFSSPEVAARMAQMELLQVDVTANNAADRELLRRFRLFGPPGIIFFDAQGREQEAFRVIGFQNAERFAAVLDRVLGNSPS